MSTRDTSPVRIPIAKRVFDIIASVIVIVVLFPIVATILALGLVERLLSSRARVPLLYRETRMSQGAPFDFYKLRTFKASIARGDEGVVHTKVLEHDFRNLTAVGMILVQLYLDEYPQLFLVLFGTMTFVGPRPTNPEVYRGYVANGGVAKTILKAGLTGHFQTHKAKKYRLDQEREDLAYAEFVRTHRGARIVLHDIKILLYTMLTVMRAEGI